MKPGHSVVVSGTYTHDDEEERGQSGTESSAASLTGISLIAGRLVVPRTRVVKEARLQQQLGLKNSMHQHRRTRPPLAPAFWPRIDAAGMVTCDTDERRLFMRKVRWFQICVRRQTLGGEEGEGR